MAPGGFDAALTRMAASKDIRRSAQDGEHAMTRATGLDAELIDSKKKMVSGTYLRNAWYVAAWSDDLREGRLLSRTVLKEPVVLYRKADGHVAALHDRCPHRFAPLHMGKVVYGERIQCPYHGLEFDAAGVCAHNPHGQSIPSRLRVRSFPVTEKHKAIWIWMGERAPDLSKVPDFSVLDNVPEAHATKRDRITIRANYERSSSTTCSTLATPVFSMKAFWAMPTRSMPKSPWSRKATTSSSAATPPMPRRRGCSRF